MITNFIVPIVTAALGALLAWILQRWIEIRTTRGVPPKDCSVFSGSWHSIHFTRSSDILVSRHRYELKVSKRGKISGLLVEEATKPAWKYGVDGRITAAGWYMRSENLNKPDEAAIEFYFNDRDEERILGFILGYDLERQPFCSFTVLSRRQLSEEDFRRECSRYRDRFYLPEEITDHECGSPTKG